MNALDTLPPAPPAADVAPHAPRLPPTALLLTLGGDERIALRGAAPCNQYGCAPLPDLRIQAFGSCTASPISPRGFAAADRLRARLAAAAAREPAAVIYAREAERLRGRIAVLTGAARIPGHAVVLGPSGTDLHLLAACLVRAGAGRPVTVVGAAAAETGRGVGAALTGRHYGGRSPAGRRVTPGTPIGAAAGEVLELALRDADGGVRSAPAVDADAARLVAGAVNRGCHVLLIVTDVSKTGLIGPSPDCAAALRRRYPGRVDVLVDACQFRLGPASVAAYLESDFAVAITGSKFIGGPSFSAALLLPPAAAQRLSRTAPPAGLGDYCARGDWPAGWSGSEVLPPRPNYGLLLRWEAALAELRALQDLPDATVAGFLQAFAAAVHARLQAHELLAPLPVPAPQRGSLTQGLWDAVPTIFPFVPMMARPTGPAPLDHDRTARLYRDLAAGVARVHLGQPVICGRRHGAPIAALRLCAGARTVTDALAPGGLGARTVIQHALAALDHTATLAALA